ncbi:MAG: HNH endonuclease [Candidatus Thermoplasmatota archaeon]|nr:HNH endonuclease [Candidatus Thermoplasmatota archaeon]
MALWTLSEEILALDLYFSRGRRVALTNSKEVKRISALTGKSTDSIVLKTANFRSLDPDSTSRGMSNVSDLDRQVWDRYHLDIEELSKEASNIYSEGDVINYEKGLGRVERPKDYSLQDLLTEAKRRIGQERVRAMALINYSNRCCICGLDYPPLLRASHIVPWSARADIRGDPANVLCLCSLHDSLFDTGLISVDASGTVLICPPNDDYPVLSSILKAVEGVKIERPSKKWAVPKAEYLKFRLELILGCKAVDSGI